MSDFSKEKFLKTRALLWQRNRIAPSSILGMSHGHISDKQTEPRAMDRKYRYGP